MKSLSQLIILSVLFLLISVSTCSRRPDPRESVKKLIAAVDQSDTTAMKEYLDTEEIIKERLEGVSPEVQAELVPKMREDFFGNLVGDGVIRVSWKNSLVVVGKTEVQGDSAKVEVTYISKQSGIKNYTQMGLYFKKGKWLIYDLKLGGI